MLCSHCSSADFRVSTVHKQDLAHLLVLQYPVRCRACHQRQYASLVFAFGLRHAKASLTAHPSGRSGAPRA